MSDFADDGYHVMLCVEAGSVSKEIVLQPGGTYTAGQTMKCV